MPSTAGPQLADPPADKNAPVAAPRAPAGPLRQLDWRLLLPEPPGGTFQHLVVLGGRPEIAEGILVSGLAKHVTRQVPPGRVADGLVVLRGGEARPEEVAGCLLPGAAVYWEVDRRAASRRSPTPSMLRRSLAARGASGFRTYWVRPDLRHSQMYLPLDARWSVRWYVDTLLTSSTPKTRLAEPILRAATRLPARAFEPFARSFALTATFGSGRSSSPAVLQLEHLVHGQPAHRLFPLVLTFGETDANRVALLPFLRNARRPSAVLKLARRPERNRSAAAEQQTMREIRTRLAAPLLGTVPEPLGAADWHGLTILSETCAPGRLLSTEINRWGQAGRRKMADLNLVANWLAAFHRESALGQIEVGSAEAEQWIDRPLSDYAGMFALSAAEERLLQTARGRAAALSGTCIPIIWQHYSLGDWNVYRDGQRVTVVDWEDASPGMPLADLAYFALHWGTGVLGLRGEQGRREAFRHVFCAPGESADTPPKTAVREAMRRYLSRMGLPQAAHPLLLVLSWVSRAVSRGQRDKGPGNEYAAYVRALANAADVLFPQDGHALA